VYAVSWSPDSRFLLSGGGDGVARLWDVGSASAAATATAAAAGNGGGGGGVAAAAALATVEAVTAGRPLAAYRAHKCAVWAVDFSPLGYYFATGGSELFIAHTGVLYYAASCQRSKSFGALCILRCCCIFHNALLYTPVVRCLWTFSALAYYFAPAAVSYLVHYAYCAIVETLYYAVLNSTTVSELQPPRPLPCHWRQWVNGRVSQRISVAMLCCM
jgi:WD domain, G-beta repeat